MEKHVELEHNTLIKKFCQRQYDVATTISLSRELADKQVHVTPNAIFGFFSSTNQFKKNNETWVRFLEDVMLLMIKAYSLMRIVESIWLQRMAYRLCPQVVFPSKKKCVDDVLSGLVEKTMLTYVHLALADYISTTCTFDLWISKGVHDVFIIVINFLSSKWEAKHIIIGLFEVSNISGATMAPRL
jgi:preprotein translocase subunit SecB